MNLTLSVAELEEEYREKLGDSAYYAEYATEWREDIESFLPVSIIEKAIVKGRPLLPPDPENDYLAFCDPSEGLRKGGDSMSLGIAHAEKDEEGPKGLEALKGMTFLQAITRHRHRKGKE